MSCTENGPQREATPAPETNLLISINEAARRLSVCRRTLEREMAAGRFPASVRIGSARRVSLAALQDYLKSLTGGATTTP
jgi:excisionase family DNA binding protein